MMTEWLCIHLGGAMASFGEAAGNTERGTADQPTRSAMLGLAGAALGIQRNDSAAQAELAKSFSTSCKTISPGTLLVDFHTFQSIPAKSKILYQTRSQALAAGTPNTSITRREYRSDGHWQIAYALKSGTGISLGQLKAAFEKPVYTLWLGRKSCPPGLPMLPELIAANNLAEAFNLHLKADGNAAKIATDDQRFTNGLEGTLRHNRRNDEPVNRSTWTFDLRDEYEFMTGGETT